MALELQSSSSVVLVAVIVLAPLYVAVVWCKTSKAKCLSGARGILEVCRAAVRRAPQSDMDKAVHEKMQESRLANLRVLFYSVLHLFPITCLVLLLELLSESGQAEEEMWRSLVQLAGSAVAFLLHLLPQLLNAKTLRPWQCSLFVLGCVHIAPGICAPGSVQRASRLSALFITISNGVLLESRTCVWQHVLFVIMAFVSQSLMPMELAERRRSLGLEIVSALVSCTCVVVLEHLVEAQHRSNLEAQCLTERQSANRKLLSVFYEVVLEVDSELTIVSSDPDLGVLLPQSTGSPIPPLLGTNLDELLEDEQDRQHLREHNSRPPAGEDASVEVLHLKMRHRGNDSLNVEVFSLCFQGLMGRWRRVLGVREFGDASPARPDGGGASQSLTLQVDTLDHNFPIAAISPGLQRELGGPAPGTSLCQLVDDPAEFMWQLDKAVNTVACDQRLDPSTSFKVVLRPLGHRGFLLATCCVTLDQTDHEPMNYVAQLSFSKLVPLARQQRSSGASVSSGSNSSRGSGLLYGTPRQLHGQSLGSSAQAAQLTSALSL